MNLQRRYGNYHSLEDRLDLLDHYPCLRISERRAPSVVAYHQETLQKFIDDGGKAVIHDTFVDSYEHELGFVDFILHDPDLTHLTIWREYCIIKNDILSMKNAKYKKELDALLGLLDAPSTELEDLQSIYFTINDLSKKIYSRENLDFYKEFFGTIFMKLLPYKLRAFGMTADMDGDIAPADEILRNYSNNYFELLLQMFANTLQTMRGSSLVDTKAKLKTIVIVEALFLFALYPNQRLEMEDLQVFTDYTNAMLASGIGTNNAETILKMQRDHTSFFDLVSQLDDKNQFLDHMIKRQEKIFDNGMKSSSSSLNKEFSSMFLTGHGRYTEKNYPKEKFEDLCYGIEGIDEDTIRDYIDLNGRKVNYVINENQMGFILKKVTKDAGSLRTPRGEVRFFIHPSSTDLDFVIFGLDDSKDVYGISIQIGPDNSRQVLKLGMDSSDYTYKLAMDETM